jgi:hypothetical protein
MHSKRQKENEEKEINHRRRRKRHGIFSNGLDEIPAPVLCYGSSGTVP